MAHGVFASLLVALRVLSFFVTCYREMLAMLLLVWKTVWLISFGLPRWMAGVGPRNCVTIRNRRKVFVVPRCPEKIVERNEGQCRRERLARNAMASPSGQPQHHGIGN